MTPLKRLLSFLLLLSYSLGMAHAMVPHSAAIEADTEHSGHEHLHHNHCDESVYDLIVCLLAETDHRVEHCVSDLYLASQNQDLQIQSPILILWDAILRPISISIDLDETELEYFDVDEILASTERRPHYSLRGPPHFSC
ncbi:hypothetical protein [Croceimicrobium hydrocarbonivorans]|uniref:Uncharacterized protein n=1 Tax=Croceimicrobium hydrocarbonivorans TaxID=2761580 RepID=A0A7H0VAL6_9FLAO|nr:hypothetical protein [Croceimicrobium hydrocarbonivorans]QNR22764.1 hypothetical protein H4K34_10260 [Croceimicrobium hydrocarbonivorans]